MKIKHRPKTQVENIQATLVSPAYVNYSKSIVSCLI